MKLTLQKLEGRGYYRVNIAYTTVFDWSTRVTDRRTGGRCLHGRSPSYLIELITPSAATQPHIAELNSVTQVGGVGDCGSIAHVFVEIVHSPLQLPVRGTISRSHFVQSSLKTVALRETWRHSYQTMFLRINFHSVSIFKLLGVLVVPLTTYVAMILKYRILIDW